MLQKNKQVFAYGNFFQSDLKLVQEVEKMDKVKHFTD